MTVILEAVSDKIVEPGRSALIESIAQVSFYPEELVFAGTFHVHAAEVRIGVMTSELAYEREDESPALPRKKRMFLKPPRIAAEARPIYIIVNNLGKKPARFSGAWHGVLQNEESNRRYAPWLNPGWQPYKPGERCMTCGRGGESVRRRKP